MHEPLDAAGRIGISAMQDSPTRALAAPFKPRGRMTWRSLRLGVWIYPSEDQEFEQQWAVNRGATVTVHEPLDAAGRLSDSESAQCKTHPRGR